MKRMWRSLALAAAAALVLVAGIQPVSAAVPGPILYGTTGRCNNDFPGGPCTETSTLVQLDARTGALIKVIGPVGYTVNGLAWDYWTRKLYASTAIGCGPASVCPFHGLITINTQTGAGKPVNPAAVNFGLAGNDSPIHSITVNALGRMVGWYDEFPVNAVTDTFVTLNKATGVATEFPDTGLQTNQNGLAFDVLGRLWNVDTVHAQPDGTSTQFAYQVDPRTGKQLRSVPLSPTTMAALGDFNPLTNLYYGLSFTAFDPAQVTFIELVNVRTGAVTQLGQTVDNLHTLAFIKKL
jgi:hypothetical protein